MPKKKSLEQENTSADIDNASLVKSAEPAPLSLSTIPQDQQLAEIEELRELTLRLTDEIQVMKTEAARNALFQKAIADVRADINATRAMISSPPANVVAHEIPPVERDDKCYPCGCVGEGCCRFAIILDKVRAAKPQIEPPDMGDIPVPPTINAMEVQLYLTVNNIGFLFPGAGSTFDLRANGFPGGPGPWVTINRVINYVDVKKGTTPSVVVQAEVREHDEGVERPIAFKDEVGEGRLAFSINCCMDTIYPPMPMDVNLIHGGEGGGTVQLAVYAQRVCC
jgi:hypothetical protein